MAEKISPWLPEQDRIRLAVLGKLIEECNELSARAARCIIHGLDETDPDTGRLNREELAREAADVTACIKTAVFHLDLDISEARVFEKCHGYAHWFRLIENAATPQLTPIGDDDSVAVIGRPSGHEFDRTCGICRRCGQHAAMAAGQPCVPVAAEAPHGEPVEPRGAGR